MTTSCWTVRTQLSLAFGPPDAKRLLNWIPAAIAVAVFGFDFVTPRGLAASTLYVLAPAACLWAPHAAMSSRMALITSALVILTYVTDSEGGVPAWISLTNSAIALALVWFVTWMVGLRNRHEREVSRLVTQVRRLRERADSAETNVCDEVSRQLHEGVGQELAAIGWALDEIAKKAADSDRVESTARELRERITVSQNALRRLAVSLRRRSVDPNAAPSEARAHVNWFSRQTGIRTELHGEQLLQHLSPEGANGAFRVLQEALTNIARHAQAASANIEIAELPEGKIRIAVSDDGRGIDAADLVKPASLGLIGLEERLRTLGGSFHIAAAPSRGTRLTVIIPRPGRS